MLGGNYARFLGAGASDGIDWSLEQTLEQMRSLDERWSGILGGKPKDQDEPGGGTTGGEPRPRPHMCC
jgi:hypothetical protein